MSASGLGGIVGVLIGVGVFAALVAIMGYRDRERLSDGEIRDGAIMGEGCGIGLVIGVAVAILALTAVWIAEGHLLLTVR